MNPAAGYIVVVVGRDGSVIHNPQHPETRGEFPWDWCWDADERRRWREAFVEAWLTGDRAFAEVLGTDEAVEAIFALEGGDGWALDHCEGAAGSSYCTFTAGGDPTVVVRVGNEAAGLGQPDAVTEVQAS